MNYLPWAIVQAILFFVLGGVWYASTVQSELKRGLVTFDGEAYYVTPVSPSHGREGAE